MNHRLLEAALRRERLLERIGNERERLAASAGGIRALCAAGDRTLAVGQKVRDNPQWVVLAAAAFVLIKPKRAWRWFEASLVVWRTWVAVRRRISGLVHR